jgi:hypothetical protein
MRVEPTTFPRLAGRSSQLKTSCEVYFHNEHKKSFTNSEALVENIGVEPTTSCMPCKRSSQLS